MDYKLVRNIVLTRFKDYDNKDYIIDIINESLPDIEKDYKTDSNISKEIYCSMLISNKVYYILLKSDDIDDIIYVKEFINRIINTIINIRDKNNKDISYIKSEDEVYDYCKDNYDGKELFISSIQNCASSYYQGLDKATLEKERLEMIESLKKDINSLKEFQKYEKKLKFKF